MYVLFALHVGSLGVKYVCSYTHALSVWVCEYAMFMAKTEVWQSMKWLDMLKLSIYPVVSLV